MSDPEIMSGAVCFVETRVPIKNLLDSINGGETLEHFLSNYSGVTDQMARAVLNWQNDLAQSAMSEAS